MYIETSSPQIKGDVARLISPTQANTNGKCLYFWYHAYGTTVATMNVYAEIQLNSTTNPRNKIWSISRNQGNDWFIARIPTDYDTDFKIIFEGDLNISFITCLKCYF